MFDETTKLLAARWTRDGTDPPTSQAAPESGLTWGF
jgi:hypothetical protein